MKIPAKSSWTSSYEQSLSPPHRGQVSYSEYVGFKVNRCQEARGQASAERSGRKGRGWCGRGTRGGGGGGNRRVQTGSASAAGRSAAPEPRRRATRREISVFQQLFSGERGWRVAFGSANSRVALWLRCARRGQTVDSKPTAHCTGLEGALNAR